MAQTVLVFELGGSRYGLDASCVSSIVPPAPLTRAPGLPAYFPGLCSVKGQIVPVIDLSKLWELPHSSVYRCMLLVRYRGETAALLADRAIRTADGNDVSTAAGSNPYILGLLPDDTAVLDAETLLSELFQFPEDNQ